MSDQNDDLSRVFPESITALVPQTDAYSGLIVHNGERSMHLRDYWRVIQNHRKAVLWTVGVWMFLATLQSLVTPNFYVAKTRVEIDPETTVAAARTTSHSLPLGLSSGFASLSGRQECSSS